MLIPDDQLWMVIVGFIVAFALAFGIGANDVANTFGSSVGSGVLTIKQACTLATICEVSGAILLGACIWLIIATFFRLPVSGTHSIVGATMGFSLVIFGVRAISWMGVVKIVASWFVSPLLSGIVSVSIFMVINHFVLKKEEPLEPALRLLPGFYGAMAVVNLVSIFLAGSSAFQFDKIPIYGVFVLGFGGGTIVVILIKLLMIPYLRRRILAGDDAGPHFGNKICAFFHCRRLRRVFGRYSRRGAKRNSSFNKADLPIEQKASAMTTDVLAGVRVTVVDRNGEAGGDNGSVDIAMPTLNRDQSESTSAAVQKSGKREFDVTPTITNAGEQMKPKAISKVLGKPAFMDSLEENSTLSVTKRTVLAQPSLPAIGEEEVESKVVITDRPDEARVFWLLQVMTSVLGSFAHGGNDVSNAIGPLMGLWIVGVSQDVSSKMANPYWILLYGGIGISIGLWIWGRRVIKTLGTDLTTITPSSGICIELGSALTVLLASKLGLPVSTTHCQVGSVIGVGRFRSRDNVNWSIFRNIIIAWLVTVPAACALSAFLMFCLTFAL